MWYANAIIFTAEGLFRRGSFRVENGRFVEIIFEDAPKGADLCGALVLPGLVDMHIHGCGGADFSDGTGLEIMGRFLAGRGVTSFCPTAMTLPYDRLRTALCTGVVYEQNRPWDEARLAGMRMEGPFLSEAKKGAQRGDWLRSPDLAAFKGMCDACRGQIAVVDVAPELDGALPFIEAASRRCRVSLGHTTADYDQAAAAFKAGARHLTHLYNAMPPLLHRAPGPIAAGAEREDVSAEIVADGIHVHESMVRLAFRIFPDRLALISDASRCLGMADGVYDLGGQAITLRGNRATLPDGTIAGSATDLFTCLQNAIRWGVPREQAIAAATSVPARLLGQHDVGVIRPGAWADFVLCDEALNRNAVYLGGRPMLPLQEDGK